jgi:hypothetical protein
MRILIAGGGSGGLTAAIREASATSTGSPDSWLGEHDANTVELV